MNHDVLILRTVLILLSQRVAAMSVPGFVIVSDDESGDVHTAVIDEAGMS